MSTHLACNVCGTSAAGAALETATVRSNVRCFREEHFEVWRCAACRSIHAREEVDLDHYYASYPSFPEELEWRLHPAYDNFLKRLSAGGVAPDHRILDYGCGSGAFVRFLRKRGYAQTQGYDAYARPFRDARVLDARYDCVVSQDVIEHVDSPHDLLQLFARLVEPGGLLVIGTPDASAIELDHPEDFVHVLHAPYHRHIVASDALKNAVEEAGFRAERFYPTMYGNTLVPGQNPRFGLHYLRCHDDCLDLLTEPSKWSLRLFTPATAFFMLFGYFFDRHTDIMLACRKPPLTR